MTPAQQGTLDAWHAMVGAGDLSGLPQLLAPDCVFRSPVAHRPYQGAATTALVLATAASVFEGFRYHRTFAAGDSVVLEFSARIGPAELKGVDLIRFDDAGRIAEFEVMVRPASGLQALGQAMAPRLVGLL